MDYLIDFYNKIIYEYADPRTKSYPLSGSPVPLFLILGSYWLFIKKVGPALMKNRPAFNIKPIIQIYNLAQVVACFALSVYPAYLLIKKGDYKCLTHETNSDHDLKFVFITWSYFMLKVLDLLDTVFFVLRKNFRLITTLHQYHHSMMVLSTAFIFRYIPGGEHAIIMILNNAVHAVMYFYYFWALRKQGAGVWWKKYITQLQLTQFCIILGWFSVKLFNGSSCSFPTTAMVFYMSQAVLMLKMFGSYYYNEFIRAKSNTQKKRYSIDTLTDTKAKRLVTKFA